MCNAWRSVDEQRQAGRQGAAEEPDFLSTAAGAVVTVHYRYERRARTERASHVRQMINLSSF